MAAQLDPTLPGDEGDQYPGDSSGHVNPALQQFVDTQDPGLSQAWAGIAAGRAQTYLTARSNTIDADQAGNDFVNHITQTRDGLVKMAQNDPGSIDLALDLARHSVNGIVDMHGHLDEDQRSGAADDLIDHFNQSIVHGAVQSLAETDKGAAMNALDKYGSYLPEDQRAALSQYADVQETMRGMDGEAQQLQGNRDAAVAGYHSATNYLQAMTDPNTGQYRAPQGFLQKLLADPSIAQTTQLALRTAYNSLNYNGDQQQSNPHVVADLIDRMASGDAPKQGEIISHLGSGLSMADATFLNHLIGPSDPGRRADIRQLGDTLQDARSSLTGVANGQAGTAAFGRFVNWLVPSLARGFNLNDITQGNYLQQFAPTKEDYRRVATPLMLASDVQPLRPGSVAPFGVPGVTGEALRQMQRNGGTDYSTPRPPVVPMEGPPGNPANEARTRGNTDNA